jgi:hypothetical protein
MIVRKKGDSLASTSIRDPSFFGFFFLREYQDPSKGLDSSDTLPLHNLYYHTLHKEKQQYKIPK